jgi:hypothetical protein
MARIGNLSNGLAWGLAVLIASLERRDAAQPGAATAPTDEATSSTAMPAATEVAPPTPEPVQPEISPVEEPIAPSRAPDVAARVLERDEVPPTPTAVGGASSPVPVASDAATADASVAEENRPPSTAAPDPLIEAQPGQTIVGPDAPIHVPTPHVPTGAIAGNGTPGCPDDHPIKGNASSMIYHRPGQPNYDRTVAEFCFESEDAAEAAGYRPPRR